MADGKKIKRVTSDPVMRAHAANPTGDPLTHPAYDKLREFNKQIGDDLYVEDRCMPDEIWNLKYARRLFASSEGTKLVRTVLLGLFVGIVIVVLQRLTSDLTIDVPIFGVLIRFVQSVSLIFSLTLLVLGVGWLAYRGYVGSFDKLYSQIYLNSDYFLVIEWMPREFMEERNFATDSGEHFLEINLPPCSNPEEHMGECVEKHAEDHEHTDDCRPLNYEVCTHPPPRVNENDLPASFPSSKPTPFHRIRRTYQRLRALNHMVKRSQREPKPESQNLGTGMIYAVPHVIIVIIASYFFIANPVG